MRFATRSGLIVPVRDVSFSLSRGERVGIVGESGSGKSLTALALAGLVPAPGEVEASTLRFLGRELREPYSAELRRLLGTSFAMVFQDPGTSLNPSLPVGRQLAEVAEVHRGMRRSAALALAVDRLRSVRIASPARRARQYPHELSGGMRQRAMIAMGLMGDPALIIADEPTSALDVTVQQQILRLLQRISADTGTAVLLISHDIAVVSVLCQRVLVMYAGRIVEDLPVTGLPGLAVHPYTRALIASLPDLRKPADGALASIPGRPPEPSESVAGCPFAPRCAHASSQCHAERPELTPLRPGQLAACWHPQLAPVAEAAR